jgi:hypothetical protein
MSVLDWRGVARFGQRSDCFERCYRSASLCTSTSRARAELCECTSEWGVQGLGDVLAMAPDSAAINVLAAAAAGVCDWSAAKGAAGGAILRLPEYE